MARGISTVLQIILAYVVLYEYNKKNLIFDLLIFGFVSWFYFCLFCSDRAIYCLIREGAY